MTRVYISSIYEDLRKERVAVRDAVLSLGHLPVAMETMSASERRPSDACIRDVEDCQLYVGIVAWRYGYCPPPHDKSITHLEYEEARRCGIPRLVFLLDESAPWPGQWVERDRRLLDLRRDLEREHVVGYFTNADDLAAKVALSLSQEIGSGMPIPELLPHLADRTEQEYELEKAVYELRARGANPLLLSIVHGDEYQCLDKFLDRLTGTFVPKISSYSHDGAVTRFVLDWPSRYHSREALQARLLTDLSEKVLGHRSTDPQELNRALGNLGGTVVIDAHILTEDCYRHGTDVVTDFVGLWEAWPPLSLGLELLIFLFVKYQTGQQLGFLRRHRLRATNARIRRFLDLYAPIASETMSLVVLPVLEGVTQSDAEAWARNYASDFVRNVDIFPEIRVLYEREAQGQSPRTITMETLAEELMRMLYKYNGVSGSY